MKIILLKTSGSLIFSFLLTLFLTQYVFYPDSPTRRPVFTNLSERISSPIIGSKGEPIKPGVDPTPPPGIYY